MGTKHVKCDCHNPYLDKKLGKGIRVANLAEGLRAKKDPNCWRCTTCTKLRS